MISAIGIVGNVNNSNTYAGNNQFLRGNAQNIRHEIREKKNCSDGRNNIGLSRRERLMTALSEDGAPENARRNFGADQVIPLNDDELKDF